MYERDGKHRTRSECDQEIEELRINLTKKIEEKSGG